MYVVLIYKRKSKYQFVNYEIQYHPFYKNVNFNDELKKVAPNGIDIFFDNVSTFKLNLIIFNCLLIILFN